MNTQNERSNVGGPSVPESEPVVVIGNNRGQHLPAEDAGTVKTASEPLASFTMKCSKANQTQ
jgi:hypothetical protein